MASLERRGALIAALALINLGPLEARGQVPPQQAPPPGWEQPQQAPPPPATPPGGSPGVGPALGPAPGAPPGVVVVAPPAQSQPWPPPGVGAPPWAPPQGPMSAAEWATINAWYEAQIADLKGRIRAADQRGDEAEVQRAKQWLDTIKRDHKAFRDRTTERRSVGMMAGGIVLSGVGLAGLVTTFVLAFASAFEHGSDQDQLATAALFTGLGSAGCIGAGIPMIVVGAKRVPKQVEGAPAPAPPVESASAALVVGPWSGVTGRF